MDKQANDDGAAAGALTHTVRPSAFAKERTYRLEPDAIAWTTDGRPGSIAYRDIGRAQIFSLPPYRRQTARRAASYLPFVEELLARIEAANPNLAIRVGPPLALYVFWVLMFVFFILMVPLMLVILFDADGNPEAPGGLAVAGFFIWKTGRVVWYGRPRKADAAALYASDIGGGRRYAPRGVRAPR